MRKRLSSVMSKRKLWALLTFIAFIMWQVLFLGTMFKVKKDVPKHVEIDWDEALPYRNRSQTRRLASPSNAIHCVQTPLYLDQESTFKLSTEVTEKKFAYVWYASSDVYLCSAMTALKITKDLRSQEKSSHLKVDFVLMLVESDFRKSNLTQQWTQLGGIVRKFPPLPYPELGYYEATYQRFRAFQLTEYEQIVVMDADGFPMQNLDHLFLFNLPPSIKLAAPQAYWFNDKGVVNSAEDRCPGVPLVLITSVLLVVKPDLALFDRVEQHFGSRRFKSTAFQFDMDILIQEFCCRDDIFILPKHYGTLDSELKLTEPLNVDLKQCRDWKDTQYLHFSHKGKPWTRSQAINTKYYSKGFSEDVLVTIQEWFTAAHYFCPSLISPLEIKTK